MKNNSELKIELEEPIEIINQKTIQEIPESRQSQISDQTKKTDSKEPKSTTNYVFYTKILIFLTLILIPIYFLSKSKYKMKYYITLQSYLSTLYQKNKIKAILVMTLIMVLKTFSLLPIYDITRVLIAIIVSDFLTSMIIITFITVFSLFLLHLTIRYLFKEHFLEKYRDNEFYNFLKTEMEDKPVLSLIICRSNFFPFSYNEIIMALLGVNYWIYFSVTFISTALCSIKTILVGLGINDIQKYNFNFFRWKNYGDKKYGKLLLLVFSIEMLWKFFVQLMFVKKVFNHYTTKIEVLSKKVEENNKRVTKEN